MKKILVQQEGDDLISPLEALAYRLLFHDIAAARREELPLCIKAQGLLEYFRKYRPVLVEWLK